MPLTVRAWDENGAAVAGLAARLTVQVDGAARAVAFTEGPAGRYVGTLSTTGLAVGGHQVARGRDRQSRSDRGGVDGVRDRAPHVPAACPEVIEGLVLWR